jgi:hypothetical protein
VSHYALFLFGCYLKEPVVRAMFGLASCHCVTSVCGDGEQYAGGNLANRLDEYPTCGTAERFALFLPRKNSSLRGAQIAAAHNISDLEQNKSKYLTLEEEAVGVDDVNENEWTCALAAVGFEQPESNVASTALKNGQGRRDQIGGMEEKSTLPGIHPWTFRPVDIPLMMVRTKVSP